MSCGVTVVTAVMKDIATKTANEFVRHKPSHYDLSLAHIELGIELQAQYHSYGVNHLPL